MPFWATKDEIEDVEHIYNCWKQVYTLTMKHGGKELDPKFFDALERAEFNKSDAEEWSQWIKNKVIRVLTPQEERQVPKDKIFAAPLRFVRTNKGVKVKELKAKSRLVVPGHKDPELGEFRTDSPTTSTLAVQVAVSIAVSKRWPGETFDVSTAFLSGKATSRQVYVRAPAEGLPAVEGEKAVRPRGLLEILKGAYGLAEAPRLWYLRARELLAQCGFEELRVCRSVFCLRDANKQLSGIVTLHVDDGLIFGDPNNKTYREARKKINENFNIKEWHKLDAEIKRDDEEYLGARWNQDIDNDVITCDMDRYFKTIEREDEPSRKVDGETELDAKQQRFSQQSNETCMACKARNAAASILHKFSLEQAQSSHG